jgi:tetratricopeptide (TPR) repeat protein
MTKPRALVPLAVTLALALCLGGSAAAQLVPADIWPQATAALDTGDIEAAEAKLSQLLDLGTSLGIKRFPLYAESASALAHQLSTDPANRDASDWALAAAQRLDPRSAAVAFTSADIAWERRDFIGAARSLATGVARSFTEPNTRASTRADLVTVIAVAIGGAAALFAFSLFFRYAKPAAHDFREILSEKTGISPGIVSVLALAALVLPLFVWLGPTWVILYWMALFFGYATASERAAIVALLVLLAILPTALDWSVYRVVGSTSPVIRAAQANVDDVYNPEAVRRLRELVELAPEDARLQLLLGTLELQVGNEQQASIHFREAIKLDETLAGAHINLGNIDFFHNEFRAAMTKYETAIQLAPDLATPYFNLSAASGEVYDYNRQKEMLDEARSRSRAIVQRLLTEPPAQKVVMYDIDVDDAWALVREFSARGVATELFGNYSRFSLGTSLLNPLTGGAILALIIGPLTWMQRKRRGFAGSCMKCGRTFCYRCKSSRESATYCTQCIHIYLKRDGVSLDTKQSKVNEVRDYQIGQVRMKKILATFFPGSGQIIDGATAKGLIYVFFFLLFIAIAVFVGHLVPISQPAALIRTVVRIGAIVLAVITWFLFSIPVYRQRPLL